MTPQERKVHSAIYKLITPDKPVIVVPVKGEGDRKSLETLMQQAQKRTRTEINRLVRTKHFTKTEGDEVLSALQSLTKLVHRKDISCLVAVFPELKDGDLHLNSIAIAYNGN